MTKPRRHLDEVSVNLPEIVVMPRGSYIDWKGDEDIVPSKEQFIDDTVNKRRVEAIHSMLNKKAPAIPNNPSRNPLSILASKLGASDDTRRFVFGVDKNGQTCIYTVSSNYNDKPISGNKTFANNPESYGFKEVNSNDAILGDIVQFYGYNDIINNAILGDEPHHMTMITGFNENGQPALSYSNGGRNADDLRKDNDNWGEGGDRDLTTIGKYTKTYRYVGSPELRKKTSSHYDYIYGKRSNMTPLNTKSTLVKSRKSNKDGGSIHIAPSKRGTFTAAATKHGMGVQEFAARVLRNKEDYSPSLVKKANFARNASKWH